MMYTGCFGNTQMECIEDYRRPQAPGAPTYYSSSYDNQGTIIFEVLLISKSFILSAASNKLIGDHYLQF
jgi:hypothetical protein